MSRFQLASPLRPVHSLRMRLLAAFVLVILLTLVSAGSAVVWVVQAYRTRIDIDHLSETAFAGAMSARNLERLDARPEEIAAFVANLVNRDDVRVLVLDAQDRVVAERPPVSGGDAPLAGRRIAVPPAPEATPSPRQSGGRGGAQTRISVWRMPGEGVGLTYLMTSATLVAPQGTPGGSSPDARTDGIERFLARQPTYRIVLALPERYLASAWRELAPRLALVALFVVPISMAVAWWLARSITSRLGRITGAAQAIARGDLQQRIPVQGSDEVADLAAAFNTMSQEVAASQSQLRAFVANASHELRTPLTSIQGFSQALVDGALPGPEGAIEAGQIILEESERMSHLVDDLLYLSRMEATTMPSVLEPVDLVAQLREALRRVQLAAGEKDLRIRTELGDLPLVSGSREELDRLFGNLLDNARKYTPAGGVVTVRAWTDGSAAHVTVHNSGSYIPPEDLPHIFDRFYRVDKSRARAGGGAGKVEGSGLGLAIVAEVVERHSGSIEATSDQDAGTTFHVTLPLPASERVTAAKLPARRSSTLGAPATASA